MTWTDLTTVAYEYRIELFRTEMALAQLMIIVLALGIYRRLAHMAQRLLELKTARTMAIRDTEEQADAIQRIVDALMAQQESLARDVAVKAAAAARTVAHSLETIATDLKTNTELTIAAGAASAAATDAANHVNDKLHAIAQGGPVQVEVVNNPLVTTHDVDALSRKKEHDGL